MLDRFIKLENAIRSTVALLDVELPILTFQEWKIVGYLCTISKPFYDVTNTISGEKYCTASMIILLTNGLNKVLFNLSEKDYLPAVLEVISKLKIGLSTRLGNIESSHTLQVCTFLDPRFKHLTFSLPNYADNARKLVTNALTNSTQIEINRKATDLNTIKDKNMSEENKQHDELSVWSAFEEIALKFRGIPISRALLEIQHYLEEDILQRKADPLDWWKNHSVLFPRLSKFAKEKLRALGTSVPCERLFSKAGLIVSERRNHLSDNKTKILFFLNSNAKWMSK